VRNGNRLGKTLGKRNLRKGRLEESFAIGLPRSNIRLL
jgi:hypothetical protein